MNKKRIYQFFCIFFVLSSVFSQEVTKSGLHIGFEDLYIIPDRDVDSKIRGFHLYVRKKNEINSIMLTETTKDVSGKSDNYAYRTKEYNKINGDEIRVLNGKPLDSEYAKYSLIDSTPERNERFGSAFHIYIPKEIEFGYPWSRNGKVVIGKGTFLNIRTFSEPYADYSGSFYDNPFMFDLGKASDVVEKTVSANKKEEVVVLTDEYNPIASEKFDEISDFMIYSKGPETIVSDIMQSLMQVNPKQKVDIVFVLDSTGSMKDDVEKLRKEWIPELTKALKDFGEIRLGLLLYRDYVDSYRYNGLPVRFFKFTSDINSFTRNLNNFSIKGTEGGDIPEAVYEGLYAGIKFFDWDKNAQKKIILIGDAEPHPVPRGTRKYTKELVVQLAKENSITINAIITPDEKSRRGR